jgi:hypothetical protein
MPDFLSMTVGGMTGHFPPNDLFMLAALRPSGRCFACPDKWSNRNTKWLNLWMHNLKTIKDIFELLHHMIIFPVAFFVFLKLKYVKNGDLPADRRG